MRIILINLDGDTERRRRVEGRLRALGLDWERLPAVDGRRLTPSHEVLVDRKEQAARGLRISPGEIGCWLSHRAAQRKIAEGPERMALILEDDLDVHEDLPDVLARIEQGAAGRFDVAYLHRCKLKRRYSPVRLLGGGHTLGFVRPADSGTLAYVMTRDAARRYIERVPRMVHIADHALYQSWVHGLVVCSIDPPVVLHRDEGRSSIAARPLGSPAPSGPRPFMRRKRHQIAKKCARRLAFHRNLKSALRTGRLSRLP